MDWLSPQTWIDQAILLGGWVQEHVLTWTSAIQVSSAFLAFALAHFLARRARKWVSQYRAHPVFGVAIGVLLPLILPLL